MHVDGDVETENAHLEAMWTDGTRLQDIEDMLSDESGPKDVQTDGVEQTVPASREAMCTEGT